MQLEFPLSDTWTLSSLEGSCFFMLCLGSAVSTQAKELKCAGTTKFVVQINAKLDSGFCGFTWVQVAAPRPVLWDGNQTEKLRFGRVTDSVYRYRMSLNLKCWFAWYTVEGMSSRCRPAKHVFDAIANSARLFRWNLESIPFGCKMMQMKQRQREVRAWVCVFPLSVFAFNSWMCSGAFW